MNFEDLTKLIEEHKKETHPYKRYDFDSTSYTLLLIDINNLIKENQKLNSAIQTYDILLKANAEENKKLKDNWIKLKEWLKEYEEGTYGLGSYEAGLSDGLGDVIKKMQELEQGSDSNE